MLRVEAVSGGIFGGYVTTQKSCESVYGLVYGV
jgi:hypothetical protein